MAYSNSDYDVLFKVSQWLVRSLSSSSHPADLAWRPSRAESAAPLSRRTTRRPRREGRIEPFRNPHHRPTDALLPPPRHDSRIQATRASRPVPHSHPSSPNRSPFPVRLNRSPPGASHPNGTQVLLIGDSAVGKSSLVKRYTDDEYDGKVSAARYD